MIEGKTKAEMDQAFAFLTEYYPPLWRKLYLGCIEEGFTKEQSFKLLRTYISGICSLKGEDD